MTEYPDHYPDGVHEDPLHAKETEPMNDNKIIARRVAARLARTGFYGIEVEKVYDDKGIRLTDCCSAYSTHAEDDGRLICKACYVDVDLGEGDGNETKEG